MTAWNIYLHNRKVDTVFYSTICERNYVYYSLVQHDGLDARIKVRKAR